MPRKAQRKYLFPASKHLGNFSSSPFRDHGLNYLPHYSGPLSSPGVPGWMWWRLTALTAVGVAAAAEELFSSNHRTHSEKKRAECVCALPSSRVFQRFSDKQELFKTCWLEIEKKNKGKEHNELFGVKKLQKKKRRALELALGGL